MRALALALLLALPAQARQTGTGQADRIAEDAAWVPFTGRIRAKLSGFTDAHPGSLPKRNAPCATIPPLTLPDPATARVVIWSHGTANSHVRENCSAEGNAVPPSLRALEAEGVFLWFVCSDVAVRTVRAPAGDYILKRMAEVSAAIEAFLALGVPARNIFLAGHSAGGMDRADAGEEWGGRIGGIIAHAPAFAGKRDNPDHPFWRQEARPRLIAMMEEAETMRALVFASTDDAFNRPQELAFLTRRWPGGVQLIAYGCDPRNDHMSHLKDCRLKDSTAAVRTFVLGR